jgi:hypothetical protein
MTRSSMHVLARVSPGGLLLDLQTGNLFCLNASAALVWERWLAGAESAALVRQLADEHGLPVATASEHVAAALSLSTTDKRPSQPIGEYRYEPSTSGYVFTNAGAPVLSLDANAGSLELAPGTNHESLDLSSLLLGIAPKVAALRGLFVLHASAASLNGTIVAFCGESGAGKTTTVRAVGGAGAKVVSEDKLVIRRRGSIVEAWLEGERVINDWARVTARRLAAGEPSGCEELDTPSAGEWLPLVEIGFIHHAKRSGDSIVATRLDALQAASSLFQNAFHGSGEARDWSRQLHTVATFAKDVAGYELVMPAGIQSLQGAATSLIARGTLRSR